MSKNDTKNIKNKIKQNNRGMKYDETAKDKM